MAAGARELTAPHYSSLPWDRELRIVSGVRVARGRFEVREELARGGMAVVYRAIDHEHGDIEVALKVGTARADRPETEARFHNEARLGASLAGHPHVVSPLGVGRLDGPEGFEGRMYLVTELVDGTALDLVIAGHPTGLPVRRACAIARDVAQALADLHDRGIVHRDIKPGNVVLAKGSPERARVIDFGLAYATGDGWEDKSPDLTEDGGIPGTPLYMSPQQAAHQRPTPAFDVYSMGVMMYELFAGDPPYAGLALGELLAHKCDPSREPYPLARLCAGLPEELATLVHRCLRHEPGARPSACEMVERLDEALRGSEAWTPVIAPDHPPSFSAGQDGVLRSGQREIAALVVGALGVLGVLGATGAIAGMVGISGSGAGERDPSLTVVDPLTLTVATYAKTEPHDSIERHAMAETLSIEPLAVAVQAPVMLPDQRGPTVLEDGPTAVKRAAATRAGAAAPNPRITPAPESRSAEPVARSPSIESKPTSVSKLDGHQPEQSAEPEAASVVEPALDLCPDDPLAAREAAKDGQWTRVLRLTHNVRCWPSDAMDERIKLRTWALYETEHFSECAEQGRGSLDRNVARWTAICTKRVREGGNAP